MPVFDLFSKRKKLQEAQGKTDVYQYVDLPTPFRIQVAHIWRAAIGRWRRNSYGDVSPTSTVWEGLHDIIAREKGVWFLGDKSGDPEQRCTDYLMTAPTDDALDIIELSFRGIDNIVRGLSPVELQVARLSQSPDAAIEELNTRFRENGIGYQYLNGEIVQVDSQYLHSETVKPALALLNDAGFSGPASEFMSAFDHHRKDENKEAIADALKALESTMKAICAARNWAHHANATAKPLMDILFQNKLVPPEMESHFAALRSAMESGLPTLANKTSRHGQGATPVEVPAHFAAYALHLAASNIVFLVECHKAKK